MRCETNTIRRSGPEGEAPLPHSVAICVCEDAAIAVVVPCRSSGSVYSFKIAASVHILLYFGVEWKDRVRDRFAI